MPELVVGQVRELERIRAPQAFCTAEHEGD